MFVANLSPMAIGLVLLLGSMAAAVTITLVVVALVERHNRLELEREFTAMAEYLAEELEYQQLVAWAQRLAVDTFEPDDDELLIIDDSDEGEDFAEWEVRSVEEADDRARLADLDRDLRICGDMVDELAADLEHQQLVREMQALAVQTFEPDDDELLIIDDSDEGEDFDEYEARSIEDADRPYFIDYCKRKLRHVEDYIDAIERHQINLIWHPDCEGRDALPHLAWIAEGLRVEEAELRKELGF